jgi:hypothetical protein
MACRTHPVDKRLLRLNCAQNILVIMGARPHFQVMQMERSRCGVREMRSGLVVGLALALATLAGSAAYAFQEQNSGTAPQAAQPQQAPAEQQPAGDKALNLSDETGPGKGEEGTEIRIPGLGKLGVLPKMDFGLELLYGAADQKQPEGTPEAAPSPEDDLMIRGTVKHRF